MKIIVFDLWGDYGHFRVPYTTSSPLTFPIPTKPALYGIVGAILGYDKNNYLSHFQNKKWMFAVEIKNPILKTYIPENFINTKEVKMFARMPKSKSCRTQINMEFLKQPFYRIYVHSNEKDFNNLETFLKEHKTNYTVTLGISECIANFQYIGTFDCNIIENNNKPIDISSIIPLPIIDSIANINFEEGKKFLKIHTPLELNINRELSESQDFLIEANGKAINITIREYVRIDKLNKNIILF